MAKLSRATIRALSAFSIRSRCVSWKPLISYFVAIGEELARLCHILYRLGLSRFRWTILAYTFSEPELWLDLDQQDPNS